MVTDLYAVVGVTDDGREGLIVSVADADDRLIPLMHPDAAWLRDRAQHDPALAGRAFRLLHFVRGPEVEVIDRTDDAFTAQTAP